MALIQVLKTDGTASIPIPVTEDMMRGYQPSAPTAAGAPNKARDAAASAADTGTAQLLIRRDVPAVVTPIVGDYEVPQVNAYGAQWVQPMLGNNGGAAISSAILAATTNAAVIKASAGTLNSITLVNNNAAWAYLKLFNKATTPVPGTDTPVATFGMPPNFAIDISFPTGLAFSTGIGVAITAGIALLDATAVIASQGSYVLGYA